MTNQQNASQNGKTIRSLYVPADIERVPQFVEVKDTARAYAHLLGCQWIEVVALMRPAVSNIDDDSDYAVVADEEAALFGKREPNRRWLRAQARGHGNRQLGFAILGDLVVVKRDAGVWVDLDDADVARLCEMFEVRQ